MAVSAAAVDSAFLRLDVLPLVNTQPLADVTLHVLGAVVVRLATDERGRTAHSGERGEYQRGGSKRDS
jgi:hypothetical protein